MLGITVYSNGVVWWLTRWSRSTKLLYIWPGYYLDGWPCAVRYRQTDGQATYSGVRNRGLRSIAR